MLASMLYVHLPQALFLSRWDCVAMTATVAALGVGTWLAAVPVFRMIGVGLLGAYCTNWVAWIVTRTCNALEDQVFVGHARSTLRLALQSLLPDAWWFLSWVLVSVGLLRLARLCRDAPRCPECGERLSLTADSCPRCGTRLAIEATYECFLETESNR